VRSSLSGFVRVRPAKSQWNESGGIRTRDLRRDSAALSASKLRPQKEIQLVRPRRREWDSNPRSAGRPRFSKPLPVPAGGPLREHRSNQPVARSRGRPRDEDAPRRGSRVLWPDVLPRRRSTRTAHNHPDPSFQSNEKGAPPTRVVGEAGRLKRGATRPDRAARALRRTTSRSVPDIQIPTREIRFHPRNRRVRTTSPARRRMRSHRDARRSHPTQYLRGRVRARQGGGCEMHRRGSVRDPVQLGNRYKTKKESRSSGLRVETRRAIRTMSRRACR
jgi:hypothetical protein